MWNRAAETISRADLQELQLARLKKTLTDVYASVPTIARRMDDCGFGQKQIDGMSLQDLKHLPFTRKTDLRENYPFGLFARPMDDIVRLHASSGTKGKPTVVGYTRNDIETWAEACARSLAAACADPFRATAELIRLTLKAARTSFTPRSIAQWFRNKLAWLFRLGGGGPRRVVA